MRTHRDPDFRDLVPAAPAEVAALGRDVDPYERAVLEALAGGTIVRTQKSGKRKESASTPATGRPAPANTGELRSGHVPATRLSAVGEGERLLQPAAQAFRRLDAAAKADGIDFRGTSGYGRTPSRRTSTAGT